MIGMWSARAVDLIEDKVPLEIVWNGAELYNANLMIPKGDPNAKAARGFCNFVAQAKPQADFRHSCLWSGKSRRPCTHERNAARSDAGMARQREGDVPHDAAWIAPRLATIRERWTQWLTS